MPPKEPPCKTCKVEPLKENEQAGLVYMLVRNQVILSPSGEIVDLNINAVNAVMDIYDVKDKKGCFEKVLRLFYHFQEQNKNRNKEEEKIVINER